MGSKNVMRVLADDRLRALSPLAQLTLIRMAQVAYDSGRSHEDEALYWESHAALAARLGLLHVGSDARSASVTRRVRRAIQELVGAGLIERLGSDHGCRQTYRILDQQAVDKSDARAVDTVDNVDASL